MSLTLTPESRGRAAFVRFGSRPALIAFGWLNVGLGMIGVLLPLLPTTVFMLIALWAFSKSSPRFHDWLYTHPRFGPVLRDWQQERAIPSTAKMLSVIMMAISITWLSISNAPLAVVVGVSIGLGALGVWIVTRARPSRAGHRNRHVALTARP